MMLRVDGLNAHLYEELGCKLKDEIVPIQTDNIFALYQLLKLKAVPIEVLEAFLYVHAYLLDLRKPFSAPSEITVRQTTTAEADVVLLAFSQNGLTLRLPSDLLRMLEILEKYFANNDISQEVSQAAGCTDMVVLPQNREEIFFTGPNGNSIPSA